MKQHLHYTENQTVPINPALASNRYTPNTSPDSESATLAARWFYEVLEDPFFKETPTPPSPYPLTSTLKTSI